MQKNLRSTLFLFVFLAFEGVFKRAIRLSGLPAECHSLNVKNASGESKFLFPVSSGEQAGTCAFALLVFFHRPELRKQRHLKTRISKETRFMNQLNNRINLDRAVGAAENISKGKNPMRNSSKKTPWRLRFAGAILAVAGILIALSGREIQS